MWHLFFALSIFSVVAAVAIALAVGGRKRGKLNLFNFLLGGVAVACFFMFMPIHLVVVEQSLLGSIRAVLLSVFNTIQVFAFGCEFGVVTEGLEYCPENISMIYQVWISMQFVIAPVFTFGFVLSLFKNVSANLRYIRAYFKDVYIFSELNDKSLVLAADIKRKNKGAVIVFTDVFEDNEEDSYELLQRARELDAINFKKDVLVVNFKRHAAGKSISFFAIAADETENLNHALKLIEHYRERANTHLYVFSTKIESELLLTSIDKGKVKVRRINEVKSLINRVLYEQGGMIFDSAREDATGTKQICAVVVGMGNHGVEMVKALTWYGQMDGYRLQIHAFDRDPLAQEKFAALAPELMSEQYNGVIVEGEAQYRITIHSGVDVQSITFAEAIHKITDTSYVFVALGNDDTNINAAVQLRMHFERMKIHPVIQAVVYNSQQKKALEGIQNYRGQAYDIAFIGDVESSFTEDVIIDSKLEEDALRRHLKWGNEEEFWTYEYNYNSSMASAIHLQARLHCGMPGAGKKEEELTQQERDAIEVLEHRRWNAYMRSEGYVYSGSKEKSSRNDLAKMHHDLVDFESLSEEEKRKDSSVASN